MLYRLDADSDRLIRPRLLPSSGLKIFRFYLLGLNFRLRVRWKMRPHWIALSDFTEAVALDETLDETLTKTTEGDLIAMRGF